MQSVGAWEKVKDLGAGAFGVVSLWKNSKSNEFRALKICRNDGEGFDAKSRENWSREVDKMAKLNHLNIIKILPLPDPLKAVSTLPILCMEFCARGDLRKELYRVENICGLPEESVKAVLFDIKAAIEYLHSIKIIHRDLKPENILLQEVPDSKNNSTKIVYKLIDLGFAKEWDQSSLCSTFVGTLQYIAPELFTQNASYDRSMDYWSFGLVCHEIITGFRPFVLNIPITAWVNKVCRKSSDIICIYETVDGNIEYRREIFPENHITQPLKYALEDWLRIALEWDGKKRGKSRQDNSLIIFSSLESALRKKVVTVYCVRKLERLSYEIDESTLVNTLRQWIERDTGLAAPCQLLLLPSGEILEDAFKPVLPNLENDPTLVAMLYVVSREEGVKLPQVETLQSKHPPLVRRMLEFPVEPLPFDIIRRTWANSVFFIQSILESYRAFIEAYSAKMLSLIEFQKKRVLEYQSNVNSLFDKLNAMIELSKKSLKVDVENINKNHFSCVVDSNQEQQWKSKYQIIDDDLKQWHSQAQRLMPSINPKLQKIIQLQDFEEPGQAHVISLSNLLTEARKLYAGLMKIPRNERGSAHDSSPMVQIIFQLWEIIRNISDDRPFDSHLKELFGIEVEIDELINELTTIHTTLCYLQSKIRDIHINRQLDIWNIAKLAFGQPPIRPYDSKKPSNLPPRSIELPLWRIQPSKKSDSD